MAPDVPAGHRWGSLPLSRRGLLLAAAGGLAAGVAGAPGIRRPAWAEPKDDADAYQQLFQGVLADKNANVGIFSGRGREYLYRPGQLLVRNDDAGRVQEWLIKSGNPANQDIKFSGVTKLTLPPDADIPGLVASLRDRASWPGNLPPMVQPHHVMVGFGNIMGNPQGPPRTASAIPPPTGSDGTDVTVGICDTGICKDVTGLHPLWLGGHYTVEDDDDDVDRLYLQPGVLAPQGGHGTFVAGVLRQAAPGARFDPETALNPSGIGDEQSLTEALAKLGSVKLVNMSLGYYTDSDQPPMPLVNALDARRDTVVVAAAGNSHSDRMAWPAALDDVVAVAALARTEQGGPAPASYSNYGKWVNACAYGERVSTYVTGELRLPHHSPVSFPLPAFAQWDGTSFATPWVTGWLAKQMSRAHISAVQARASLLSRSKWDSQYGVFVE